MFNIEEQIKKWLGLNEKVPVVEGENSDKKQVKKTSLASNEIKTNSKDRDDMVDTVKKYYEQIDKIQKENKIEYDDSDIINEYEKAVKEEVDNKYKPQELKLADDLTLNEKKANDKIEDLEYETNKKLDDIDKKYQEIANDTKENSIKSGLSRSSIINEKLKDLGFLKLDEYNSVNLDSEMDRKNIDKQIENYKSEYQNAINNLNLKKALEIQNLLDKFKEDNKDLGYTDISGQKAKTEVNKIYTKIIDEVLNYYYQMSPEKALEAFEEDEELQEILKEHSNSIRGYLKMYK